MRSRSFTPVSVALLLLAAVVGLGLGAFWPSGGEDRPGPVKAGRSTDRHTPGSSPTRQATAIALRTDRPVASPGERVDLVGRVRGKHAVALEVQERGGGGWTDFPARGVAKSDGTFTIFVVLGQSGVRVMRVAAPDTGQVSNPVTIEIG